MRSKPTILLASASLILLAAAAEALPPGLSFDGMQKVNYAALQANAAVRWQDQAGHAGSVQSLCFTRDGEYLVSADYDGSVRVWQVRTGAVVGSAETTEGKLFLASDSLHWVGQSPKAIQLVDLLGRVRKTLDKKASSIDEVISAPLGRVFLTRSADGSLEAWESRSLAPQPAPAVRTPKASLIGTNAEGDLFFFKADDRTIALHRLPGGGLVRSIAAPDPYFEKADLGKGGMLAATGGGDGFRLWDASGRLIREIRLHHPRIDSLTLSPSGRYVAALAANNIHVYEVPTGAQVLECDNARWSITRCAFFPNEKYLAFSSGTYIELRDLKGGASVHRFEDHSYSVRTASFSPTGKQLVAAYTKTRWDGQSEAGLLDGAKGTVQRFQKPDGYHSLNAVVQDPGTGMIAGAGYSGLDPYTRGELILFFPDGRIKTVANPACDWLSTIAMSRDGAYFLTSEYTTRSPDSTNYKLWGNDGELIRIFRATGRSGFEGNASMPAISPDARYVAYREAQGLNLYSLSGALLKRIGEGYAPAFSPDGATLAYLRNGTSLVIWNCATGTPVRSIDLKQGTGAILSVRFSPDGTLLLLLQGTDDEVMWAESSSLSIVKLATGEAVKQYRAPPGVVFRRAELSPDNRLASLVTNERRIRMLDLGTGRTFFTASFDTGAWIVFDEANRFDCPLGGESFIGLVKGLTPLGEAERAAYRRPGLLIQLMKGGSR